jgi:hypothetical protein
MDLVVTFDLLPEEMRRMLLTEEAENKCALTGGGGPFNPKLFLSLDVVIRAVAMNSYRLSIKK